MQKKLHVKVGDKVKVISGEAKGQEGAVIGVDRDKLRATYIPGSLPHRDREILTLARILGPIMTGALPSNAFLYGKPGSGKTATAKLVLNKLMNKVKEYDIKFKFAYINCNEVDTDYRTYISLCTKMNDDLNSY